MVRKNCKRCGKLFWTYLYLVKKGRRFCSTKCARTNEKRPWRKTGENKKCSVCGSEFYAYNYVINRKTCSKECADEYKSEGEIRKCRTCKKKFYTPKHLDAKYCSRKCWQENPKLYPKTWQLRRKVVYMNRIKNMDEWYVKSKIQQSSGLSFSDIPKELVDMKRLILERKRIIRDNDTQKL